jgi:hypothetical protein
VPIDACLQQAFVLISRFVPEKAGASKKSRKSKVVFP